MYRTLTICALLTLTVLVPSSAQLDLALALQVTDVIAESSAQALTLTLGEAPPSAQARGVLGLDLTAEARREGEVTVVTIAVTDTRGEDRAVDLDLSLPLDLTGWDWWHDINRSQAIAADAKLTERQYPLVVVTDANAEAGLCLAVEPGQPFVYELRAGTEGLTLHAPIGLTPAGTGDVKSRAELRVYLFPTDAAWGFRDAMARYYRLFPEAFERRAMAEGMWLFAFPNHKLPNPSHYAYNEAGPNGWEYDEEHGLGTYPYKEISSRTVHVPHLPENREQALELWREMESGAYATPANWGMRSGEGDDQVARTGGRSLRCAKDDPQAWVGAAQDVPVKQERVEPITISGWVKAEGVTGVQDNGLSLYADIQLATGEWAFGRVTTFPVGTHDWVQAVGVFELDAPVDFVRLHCLFRQGHVGTVWFDDISVTTASAPETNRCLNPSFEKLGGGESMRAINTWALHAADGHPYFYITDNVGSDVRPTTTLKLFRFTLNPSPYLEPVEGVPPPQGVEWLSRYRDMMEGVPALDGAYIDSVSGWATRCLDFRRENWTCVRNPFTYDPETKRVVAAGKYFTYDFLRELQAALNPGGRYVFTNIHNTMDTFLLYAVSDVPGIESSVTNHERFAYIRSASHHKPAVLLNFLNLHGFEARSKLDEHWRLAMLYGLYPSIGRRCDEAYDLYGDLYRRFMPSLKRISAAGWEPVTHAILDPPGPSIERFGSTADALFFTVLNESDERWTGSLQPDLSALGVTATGLRAMDTTTGELTTLAADGAAVSVGPHDVAVFQIATPEVGAATLQAELDEVAEDLRRLTGELPDEQAAALIEAVDVACEIAKPNKREAPFDSIEFRLWPLGQHEAMRGLRTWSGETVQEALLRAVSLALRQAQWRAQEIRFEMPDAMVAGEAIDVDGMIDPGFTVVPGCGWVTLLRDAGGLSRLGRTWPERGYGPGLIDVTRLVLQDPWCAAVTRTVRLRDPVEVRLETDDPRKPTAERAFTARCINNSSKPRTVRVAANAPGDGWTLTPAESEPLVIPAHESVDFRFTAQPPAGVMTMGPMRVTATSGEETLEASAQAMCGEPTQPDPNLAQAEGVEVTVSGSYGGGYHAGPISDGLFWPTGVHWTEIAWASRETGGDDWIQFTWPRAVTVSRVALYWHIYPKLPHTPRQLLVQVPDGDGWRDLADVAPDPGDVATTVEFEAAEVSTLRIMQPAGQGPAHRPNLMWVTEAQIGE